MKWVEVHDFTQEKTCTPLKIKIIENAPTLYLQVLLILRKFIDILVSRTFLNLLFGIFGLFFFHFMSNKYYLMLSNLRRYYFSVNAIFLLMRKVRNGT